MKQSLEMRNSAVVSIDDIGVVHGIHYYSGKADPPKDVMEPTEGATKVVVIDVSTINKLYMYISEVNGGRMFWDGDNLVVTPKFVIRGTNGEQIDDPKIMSAMIGDLEVAYRLPANGKDAHTVEISLSESDTFKNPDLNMEVECMITGGSILIEDRPKIVKNLQDGKTQFDLPPADSSTIMIVKCIDPKGIIPMSFGVFLYT